jgi:hypothetical protein
MFALWIRATLMRNNKYSIVLPQVDDLQEIKVMLSDRLEQWALAYIAEGELKGKLEGRQEGEMLALQKLLSKRFGAIPADITRLIANAPVESIERWLDRIIDAHQLADIFMDKDIPGPYQPVVELIRDEHAFKSFPKEHQEIILDRLDDMELDAIADIREGFLTFKVSKAIELSKRFGRGYKPRPALDSPFI